jgi:two-component system, cell cycle response regulator DivK
MPADNRRLSIFDRRAIPRGGRRPPDYTGRPVVLIVDDHVDSRELLATVLQDVGVTVAEAGTAAEALVRVAQHPIPSLVLIDLALPDRHGTQVVAAIKQNPDTREIPIVALSASVMPADKAGAADAGCIAFIEKPLLPDDVTSRVRRLLTRAGV